MNVHVIKLGLFNRDFLVYSEQVRCILLLNCVHEVDPHGLIIVQNRSETSCSTWLLELF